jgi:hypothetical protein
MGKQFWASKAVLVIIIAASAILCTLRFDSFQVGRFVDDAHYVILAQSLASNQGYRLINFPSAPTERAFAPGWPVLLSQLAAVFPGNYQVLKLLALFFWLAAIPLIYALFFNRLKSPYLEILVAIIAISPALISFTGKVMSEMPYLFFSLLTLYLFDSWNRSQNKSKIWLLIACPFAASYAFYIRSAGISLLLAIPVCLLVWRRFKQAGVVIVLLGLALASLQWISSRNGSFLISPHYENQISVAVSATKIAQAGTNAQSYLSGKISTSLVPIFNEVLPRSNRHGLVILAILTNAIILLFILLGAAISRPPLLEGIYLVLYLIIITFWTPNSAGGQSRFLVPILPFLYLYLMQGIFWSSERIFTKHPTQASAVVTGLISLIVIVSLVRNATYWENPEWKRRPDLSIGTNWIAENTPLDSIVMTINPVSEYLYMHRKTIAYPEIGRDIEKYLKINKIDYILVSLKAQAPRSNELKAEIANHLVPLLESKPDKYQLIYTSTDQNVMVFACP